MIYVPPHITHIDEVLPHVEGRKDFVVARKAGYTVIDYVVAMPDTFDHPMRVECRGLKFGEDGRLIARPLHKFRNIGETETTLPHNIDFATPHTIMDKMDGSMVHGCMLGDSVVLMTRMGRTDVAIKAELLLTDMQYVILKSLLLNDGITPIFEFIAPDNRIIIKYPTAELVLLALRETYSGLYLSRAEVINQAAELGVRPVPITPSTWTNTQDFVDYARAITGAEGYVIRFESGLWVKAKGDDYVVKHKAKDGLTYEKNVLALILAAGVDDVVPLLDKQDADELIAYQGYVNAGMLASSQLVEDLVTSGAHLDQKTFAVEHLKDAPKDYRTLAFQVRRSGTADNAALKAVHAFVADSLGSQTNVDAVRHVFGAKPWSL
jgi:RNA ligase